MYKFLRTLILPLAVISFVNSSGCSYEDEWSAQRPKTHKAKGTLMMDGQPLEGATIVMHAQAHDLSSQGVSDANGKFTLSTFKPNDGAVAGAHKVAVTKRTYEEVKTKFNSAEENSVAKVPKELLPKRYSSPVTSDIEVSIKEDGNNDLLIEISSK